MRHGCSWLCLAAALGWARTDDNEYRLYRDLLKDYNLLERPVRNHSQAVRVTLSVILQQIVDVDEQNQIIEINAWLSYAWKDYKLNWSPEHYGGVADVRFPVGKIWKPDVLLYNSVDSSFDSTYPSNLVVYSDGTVNWIPPGIFKFPARSTSHGHYCLDLAYEKRHNLWFLGSPSMTNPAT